MDNRFGTRQDGFIYIDILAFDEAEQKAIWNVLHAVERK
jgi:hypothetical protein